jgi:hypothetical protein
MYKETIKTQEDCFEDQHLAASYCSRLKTRTQCIGESVQEFANTVERLAHHTCPTLLEDHIRKEAGRAFADNVGDPDKIH